jgi:hypothetical protein
MLFGLSPLIKGFCCLYIYKKNNLSFNNLGCQTFTSRLYNLNYNPDYIIYKLKQIGPKYLRWSEISGEWCDIVTNVLLLTLIVYLTSHLAFAILTS